MRRYRPVPCFVIGLRFVRKAYEHLCDWVVIGLVETSCPPRHLVDDTASQRLSSATTAMDPTQLTSVQLYRPLAKVLVYESDKTKHSAPRRQMYFSSIFRGFDVHMKTHHAHEPKSVASIQESRHASCSFLLYGLATNLAETLLGCMLHGP